MPGIGSKLLHPERDALLLGIEFEHDDFNFLAHLDDLGGMVDAPPRHIAYMENPVDATQIDEGAVAGDVFHRSFENDAFFENF